MDFVSGFPRSQEGYNSIWVVVDCLTKLAHFLLVKVTYRFAKLVEIYVNEIIRLHSVPILIVFGIDPQFTSQFWVKFQEAFGMNAQLSITFHPQTER
jgi:hypothetical protein